MNFTTDEADLLRATLAAVSADARRAADVFYRNLFERVPQAQALFVADMTLQGEKLIATLSTVILQIENWPVIEPQIEELGLRHTAYGVQPELYAPTGDALFQMLEDVQGDGFTDAHRQVWKKAYDRIAATMIRAVERRKSISSLDPVAD